MYFFSTLFIISLLHIDTCYASIIANSTLAGVVQLSGGEMAGGPGWQPSTRPLLTIDLSPSYVLFLHSFYYQTVEY